MFHSITLKNYRTHVDSTIRLGKVTLVLGNNNSGRRTCSAVFGISPN